MIPNTGIMEKLRIGVIGFGNMGRHHVDYLSKNQVEGTQITAVADTSPAALASVLEQYPHLHCYPTAEAMFASGDVDAVIVATPHYSHPPQAIAALNANIHVLIEKPAGAYTQQVLEMNEVARHSDRVFGIMFQQRTIRAHQKMRELVQSGELGEIKRTHYVITDWFRTQAYYNSGGWRATWAGEGGGVLLNQCPHNLDLWQWICGMPVRVRAFCGFGKYHDIEVEDDVTAYVQYANGSTGVFVTSTGESPGTKSFEIVGDRGKLVLENDKLTFWRTAESVTKFLQENPNSFDSPELWTCDIPVHGGGDHIEITRNWVGAIANGTKLLAPGIEGINGLEIANAMLLSAWTDQWVDLPLDAAQYHEHLKQRVANSTVVKQEVEHKMSDLAKSF